MKLLADENADASLVAELRAAGHDVTAVSETAPSAADSAVLQRAFDDGAVLVTSDRDFGFHVFQEGRGSAGVLYLRLSALTPAAQRERAASFIETRGGELPGRFCVLGPGGARFRDPPPPDPPTK